jgi:hypothetical protein
MTEESDVANFLDLAEFGMNGRHGAAMMCSNGLHLRLLSSSETTMTNAIIIPALATYLVDLGSAVKFRSGSITRNSKHCVHPILPNLAVWLS